jgi:hypothetical protein
MKLAVAVGDLGQAPKVEDLSRSEALAAMENSLGKRTPSSVVVPLVPTTRRVALATVEPESHLALPPTWCASCRWVKTMASMLFESVLEYGVSSGSGGLRNIRTT